MTENTNIETQNEITVGEMLRNARTTGRRKREIQTISKQLCIREEFLQALEDGKYDIIPETVYILGFARNYAMELGLDPEEVVAKLKKEMGLVSEVEENEENDVAEKNVGNEEVKNEKWYHRVWTKGLKFVRNNWVWFAAGIGALLIIIAVILVVSLSSASDMNATSDNASIVQAENIIEPEYNVTVREKFGTENVENAAVILQATQESWVKVEDARGNTVFSRVLVPGDVYYVPSGDGYSAVFGNAGGVDVWVNGILAPKQGADHVRVADISMNPEKLLPAVSTVE